MSVPKIEMEIREALRDVSEADWKKPKRHRGRGQRVVIHVFSLSWEESFPCGCKGSRVGGYHPKPVFLVWRNTGRVLHTDLHADGQAGAGCGDEVLCLGDLRRRGSAMPATPDAPAVVDFFWNCVSTSFFKRSSKPTASALT